jgi:hypothetical protein
MGISFNTIYGCALGFEFIPPELAEAHDAVCGLIVDLFILRFIFWRMIPE